MFLKMKIIILFNNNIYKSFIGQIVKNFLYSFIKM